MIVYRISNCNFIKDLSGKGSSLYGGRWNSKDTYAVYTAQSRSLALLEVVVHVGKVPADGYCLATIEIPDHSIQRVPLDSLPPGWHNSPPPNYLKSIGDTFIKSNKHLVLEIPSVLMMEEHSYMLNPAHHLFSKVKIISERPLNMDERLFPKPISE